MPGRSVFVFFFFFVFVFFFFFGGGEGGEETGMAEGTPLNY